VSASEAGSANALTVPLTAESATSHGTLAAPVSTSAASAP